MVEVAGQIEAVRRSVGPRPDGTGDDRTLTLEQDLPTTPERLWAALTTPRRLARWFLPVTGDLRAGGRFALEGNATGAIERCDPGAGFRAGWEFEGEVGWIEVGVGGAAGGARLTLVHRPGVDDDAWARFGPAATGVGWDLSLLGLALHLAPGGAGDWAGEEDGGRFVELSGAAWRAADVAAGTPPALADERAERTVAAYLAPPADED
jgi:uncharacterized protein YndB with AHSA1/START domain